jgi:hypothetical protein
VKKGKIIIKKMKPVLYIVILGFGLMVALPAQAAMLVPDAKVEENEPLQPPPADTKPNYENSLNHQTVGPADSEGVDSLSGVPAQEGESQNNIIQDQNKPEARSKSSFALWGTIFILAVVVLGYAYSRAVKK